MILIPHLPRRRQSRWGAHRNCTRWQRRAARLYRQGVVIEPGDVFFSGHRLPKQFLRIGYSSIPTERIEPGVRVIANELRTFAAGAPAPAGVR